MGWMNDKRQNCQDSEFEGWILLYTGRTRLSIRASSVSWGIPGAARIALHSARDRFGLRVSESWWQRLYCYGGKDCTATAEVIILIFNSRSRKHTKVSTSVHITLFRSHDPSSYLSKHDCKLV
jgi:hypothetical protein